MKHVLRIAAQYTGSDKEEWQRAAKKFRLPYLDWWVAETASAIRRAALEQHSCRGTQLVSMPPNPPPICRHPRSAPSSPAESNPTATFNCTLFNPPFPHRAADYVKESGLPPFLNQPTLEVQTPSGKQTLPNPFLGYTIDR
jgi:hypothetical protein